jgi:transcriptional regulator with XRE-family HTH domain
MIKPNYHNQLAAARRKRGLSRKQAAQLLGYKGTSEISRLERGTRLPHLITALRLEIIYRTPVAFLFPDLYDSLRQIIRAGEERKQS